MEPANPRIEAVASNPTRWGLAGAITLAIAVYVALHARSIAGAVQAALTALCG